MDLPFSYAPDTRHAGSCIFVTASCRWDVFGRRQGGIVADARRLVVLVQVGLERKRLAASLTRVQLESRVRLHVSAQVRSVCERLPAVCAAERFLAGVRAQVPLKQPRPREGLVTDRTAVFEVVRQHVHRQRWHRHVHLRHASIQILRGSMLWFCISSSYCINIISYHIISSYNLKRYNSLKVRTDKPKLELSQANHVYPPEKGKCEMI